MIQTFYVFVHYSSNLSLLWQQLTTTPVSQYIYSVCLLLPYCSVLSRSDVSKFGNVSICLLLFLFLHVYPCHFFFFGCPAISLFMFLPCHFGSYLSPLPFMSGSATSSYGNVQPLQLRISVSRHHIDFTLVWRVQMIRPVSVDNGSYNLISI